jgi:hypothetical protein
MAEPIQTQSIERGPEQSLRSPVTIASLAIGLALTVLATNAGSYARFILHATRLDQNHLSMAAVVPLMVIVLFLNRLLKLSRGELIVVFVMPLIGATMPTYFIGKMIANFTVPYYLASPENQWQPYYESILPDYSVVPGGEPLRWFFEGLPAGVSIPWDVWVIPVFWWMTVIAAYYGCCLCLMVILRKQWVENERIDFPLMEVPLAVLEDPEANGFFRIPVLNSPLFWIGFCLTLFWVLWNVINHFNPLFPQIPWRYPSLQFGPFFPPILMRMYPIVTGFGYFMKLDILIGLWFFNFLTTMEMGLFNQFGYKEDLFNEYSTNPLAMGSQSQGAILMIVIVGFWMARGHLRDVFRKAFRGDTDVDDSNEILSYRAAVFGLIGCGLYLSVWHYQTGMEPKFILLFMLGVLVMFLGQARLVAEAGLISLRAALAPQPFASILLGTDALTHQTMVSIAISHSWCSDIKTTIMPALAHATKLFDTIQHHKRRLLVVPIVAMAGGIIATFIYTIAMGYENGAANYGGLFTGGLARWPWDDLVKQSKEPYPTNLGLVVFMIAGAAFTGLLMFARYRSPGFPFHPIGFAAGRISPVTQVILPIFLAWFIKSIIMRVGGSQGYRKARPFFIGLILGHFMGAGISFVIDMIWFPGQGHNIPFSDW